MMILLGVLMVKLIVMVRATMMRAALTRRDLRLRRWWWGQSRMVVRLVRGSSSSDSM